ncbi:MAG: class I SAM-dependent methyltransferase [Planctomycetota bacterium]|nr:class I SAM-dependent methyltransferase [Planctomycetota bacterium]
MPSRWARFLTTPVPTVEARREALGDLVARRFAPELAERVASAFKPPAWVQGGVFLEDAVFLADLIAALSPARIVEIGTCSGVSTALMLRARRWLGLPDAARSDAGPETGSSSPAIVSFDVTDWLYFDPTRLVGSAIASLASGADAGIELRRGTALDAGRELAPGSVELALIDADHRHPHPCADLAMLAPALAPGAWVAIHDVNLSSVCDAWERTFGEEFPFRQVGPRTLLEHWRGESRVSAGVHRNIAALRWPEGGLREAGPWIREAWRACAFEHEPDEAELGAIARLPG